MFAVSGEALTKRLRSKAFRAILDQEMGYFDEEGQSTGALCTRLGTEASAVQGASGVQFGLILQNIFSLGVGIILGFAYSWRLTLVTMAFIPFLSFGGILQVRLSVRFAKDTKLVVEDAGKVSKCQLELCY